MNSSKSVLFWPPGLLPNVVLAAFVSAMVIAFVPTSRQYAGFKHLWQLGVIVFRSAAVCQYVVGAGALIHVVEAVYAWRMCSREMFKTSHTSGWIGLVLLMGSAALLPLQAAIRTNRQLKTS